MKKRGQVTIFIILGLIILSATMFLFFIIADMQKQELIAAEEDIVQKSFQREGMRLYIEDCLIDSLEEGLILIGKQGRLWEGQEGGKISFQEGYNGLTVGLGESNMLYYGINYKEEIVYPESYPCKTEKEDSPDFCRYSYPDKGAFGSKEKLSLNAIEADLLGHLRTKTIDCVGEFLESNLSISKDLLEGDPIINLNFESEGISVKVEYPIELNVLDETLFHLTEFNFFYPTSFKSFISSAVTGPLRKEYEDATYTYEEVDLENSEIYKKLSPTFEKINFSEGDTVFRFHLDDGVILKEQDYLFQFIIHNRPPALDYLGKDSCDYYDYLILPGAEVAEHRFLNISANAIDPDDHNLTYTCETNITDIESSCLIDPQQEVSIINQFEIDLASPGKYFIRINATDQFGLSDHQNIVVKIEEPIDTDIEVKHPYTSFPLTFGGDYWVSIEDPTFVIVSFPSTTPDSDISMNLSYLHDDTLIFKASSNTVDEGEICFSFPRTQGDDGFRNCHIDDYKDYIFNWNYTFFSEDALYPYFQETTDIGRITPEFSGEYCGNFQIASSGDSVEVKVTQCLPHINKSYPWPFPYHKYEYQLGSDGETNFSNPAGINDFMNPFLATHACCTSGGNYASTETVCYQGESSCNGEYFRNPDDFWDENLNGYVLEASTNFCSGNRGNICAGETKFSLYDDKLTCGSPSYDGCDVSIPELCQGKTSWGIQSHPFMGGEVSHYWCNGAMGCMNVCDESEDAIVYLDTFSPNSLLSLGTDSNAITTLALNKKATSNIDSIDGSFKFDCGCSGNEGFACDSNYNNLFNGECRSGSCENDS